MDNNPPSGVLCESCESADKDTCCIGIYNNCKIIIKPMVYDYIEPIIIIVPMREHAPIWELSPEAIIELNKTTSLVAKIFIDKFDMFPNFFTGGNINNAKYGLQGVHAHIHIEPRVKGDPDYNTFPGHKNKRFLSEEEINRYKQQWKSLIDNNQNE